ncbi:MAG: extracellular solute-binding protein [Candidatus Omnitrophica bacterium]|nr:extracellular solute-binding protein [Candidatus Omnitrophota bacterium]
MKRIALKRWGLGVVALGLSLLAAPGARLPAASADEVTLDFWELSVGEELMRSLLDKFERQNPGIRIRFQQLSWDYGLDKIITAIAAGNAPDVAELGTDWVAQFSSTGVLKDLTEPLTPVKDQFLLWDPATYQGRLYGVPWLAGTRILFYNRALFARAGLNPDQPPSTWEDLRRAAKAVKALGPEFYGIGLHVGEAYAPWQEFLPFLWGNGGEILDKEWSRCLLDRPAAVEALKFYQSLKAYALVERQPQVNQLFAEGKVGIQLSGSWNFSLIPRMNPTLNFGVGILPKPASDRGTPASFAGGEILVMLKASRHPEEALKLMLFLVQEEQAISIVEAQRNITPTVKSAIHHPYYRAHPEQRLFFEQVRTAVAPPAHPEWVKMQERITRVVEEVILSNRDPEEALKEVTASINRLLVAPQVKGRLSDAAVFATLLALLAGLGIGAWILRRRKGPQGTARLSLSSIGVSLTFLSPWLITFLAFSLTPLLHSLVLSFCRYNLLSSKMAFAGLGNFWEVLKDPDFLRALWHTVLFAGGTIPPTMVLALFAAVLINVKVPFKQLYQAGLFLPVATSVIVIATIFTYLYSPGGLVNRLLQTLHLPVPSPSWLLNTKWALPAIMMMNVWASFGYYMVLFLAGLQTIPIELYEAASMDGANEWQKFWAITLPQLKPIILLATVINTIHAFQVFPEIFAMTQGGPLGATTTVVWYLYETGFHRFDMGRAAAVGYILFLITMCFSWAQMRLFKMEEQG